ERLERDKQEIAAQHTLLRQQEDRLAGLERELPEVIGAFDSFAIQLRARMDEFAARQRRNLDEVRNKVGAATQNLRDRQQKRKTLGDQDGAAEELHAADLRAAEELDGLRKRFDAGEQARDAEKAKRMPPLDEAFLDWLEKELRGRAEREGRTPKILAWLTG